MIGNREKIMTLWAVFLLGTLFHTQLGLMPLFHNLSVATSEARNLSEIRWILWAMLAFFAVPMLAIIATLFNNSRRYRTVHFGITVFYSVMNLCHIIADLLVKPIAWYQITLMLLLFLVGLLLNWAALQWMKDRVCSKSPNPIF